MNFISLWERVDKQDRQPYIGDEYFEKYKSDEFLNLHEKTLRTISDNLIDRELNSRSNRFKTMGKVKDYNLYNAYVEGGRAIVEKRRIKFHEIKYKLISETRMQKFEVDEFNKLVRKDRIVMWEGKYHWKQYVPRNLKKEIALDKLRPDAEKILPLPTNNVSRIVGVYKGWVGNKYFKKGYGRYDAVANRFLRRCNEEFRKRDDQDFTYVLPGEWQYNCKNLVTMATPHVRKYSYDDLMQGLKSRVGIELVLPELPEYNVDSIDLVRVNHTSFNGLRTSRAFGKKRAKSTPFTKPIARDYAKHVISKVGRKEYVLDTSLWHVGGRGKRVICPIGEKKEIRTRAILCQEDIPTLIGQSVVVNINEKLQHLAEGFNWGGRLNGRSQYLDLVNALDTKGDPLWRNFGIDFSQHDNRVSKEQIVFAMGLLRCCYPEGEAMDRIFIYILSSLVHKRVVLPESNLIYQISKGIPSGHTFTSILTTCTAYLTISTAISKVVPKELISKTHLQGAGDDWVGKLPGYLFSEVTKEICDNSGSQCDDLNDSKGLLVDNHDGDKPTFLKKSYKCGTIAWNPVELYNGYSYPTSRGRRLKDYIMNARVLCVSGPFDGRLNRSMLNLSILKFIEYTLRFYLKTLDPPRLGRDNGSSLVTNIVFDIMNKYAGTCGLDHIEDHLDDIDDLLVENGFTIRNWMTNERCLADMIREEVVDGFNKDIKKSMKWMWRYHDYRKFETRIRLKVFDTRKLYIKSYNLSIFETEMYYQAYVMHS